MIMVSVSVLVVMLMCWCNNDVGYLYQRRCNCNFALRRILLFLFGVAFGVEVFCNYVDSLL